ncbi:MAG: ABC transporter permease, partial [Bacteroidaceae bacterium]|nr:ABC transporter permease [Bacteroidaceae bacterium]
WVEHTFADVRAMRNGMVVVAVVVLLIALIGLIGYIQGEMVRRSKEIAVRRVCGAKVGDVLAVLGVRLLWIVLPATVCGIALAVWWNDKWLSTLAQMRCDVPLWIYIVGALLVLAVVYSVQLLLSLRAASANPVDTIKKND